MIFTSISLYSHYEFCCYHYFAFFAVNGSQFAPSLSIIYPQKMLFLLFDEKSMRKVDKNILFANIHTCIIIDIIIFLCWWHRKSMRCFILPFSELNFENWNSLGSNNDKNQTQPDFISWMYECVCVSEYICRVLFSSWKNLLFINNTFG
jgi:hypothetical protein